MNDSIKVHKGVLDDQLLVNIINLREENQLLIPVYCISKDFVYTIPEIKEIGLDYSEGSFKVCFGGVVTRYGKNPFHMEFLQYLFDSSYDVFETFDEHLRTNLTYILIETSSIDLNYIPDKFRSIALEINNAYDMINDYCRKEYNNLMNQMREESLL